MNTVTYKPNYKRDKSFVSMLVEIYTNVMSSRFMIFQLFYRDFVAGYKKSFIGVIWVLVSPITSVIAWIFLQSTGVLNPGKLDIPYPVYVLVGTMSWDFMIGVFNAGSATLGAGKAIALQVKFPHEAMFFKQLMLYLANFTIRFVIVMVAISILGYPPSPFLFIVPFLMIPVVFLMGGAGLVVSMFLVVTSDVKKIIEFVLRLLFWTVPIVYTSKIENKLVQFIVDINPLSYFVCNIRDVIIYGKFYEMDKAIVYYVLSFFFFLFCWRLFYVNEEQLMEKMI